MTGRAAALQGGLAALGLITAHLTWQREPERQPGEATIFEATKYDVTHVKYEDDGISRDYLSGGCALTSLSYTREGRTVTLEIGAAQGSYSGQLATSPAL